MTQWDSLVYVSRTLHVICKPISSNINGKGNEMLPQGFLNHGIGCQYPIAFFSWKVCRGSGQEEGTRRALESILAGWKRCCVAEPGSFGSGSMHQVCWVRIPLSYFACLSGVHNYTYILSYLCAHTHTLSTLSTSYTVNLHTWWLILLSKWVITPVIDMGFL